MAASPGAFRYLSPLAMDNVIYQIHFYGPMEFTHQGVASYARKQKGEIPFWPDPSKGWDRDYIRKAVKQARVFQEKHKCRIYVGEFSAVGYAPGADQWIRDAISVFEEYGWDWPTTPSANGRAGAWSTRPTTPRLTIPTSTIAFQTPRASAPCSMVSP